MSNPNPENAPQSWQVFAKQRASRKTIEAGFAAHQAGDLIKAEQGYRDFLAANPDDMGGLRLLGTLCYQQKKYDEAEALLLKVLEANPNDGEILNNLGAIYRDQEKFEAAQEIFVKAVGLNRYHWQSHGNLAKNCLELKNYELAFTAATEALQLNPDLMDMHKVLGDSAMYTRKYDVAVSEYRLYVEHAPEDAEAINNLAFSLEHGRGYDEAMRLYKIAFDLRPDSHEIGLNYGNILMFFKRYNEAVEAYRKALVAKPMHIQTYISLIQAMLYQFNLDRAFYYTKVLETLPDYEKSGAKSIRDRVYEYVFAFGEEDLRSANLEHFDNLPPQAYSGTFLTSIKFCTDAEKTLRLSTYAKNLGNFLAETSKMMETKTTVMPGPRAHKKIRLGLLSSDLRSHVVVKFLLPFIKTYDRDVISINCYSPLRQVEDGNQKIIREHVDQFHFVEHKTMQDIANLILEDENDVLIDLNGFTADSRLTVMAKRLAPVHMEWIGYPFTTGLPTIDYMIFDRYNQPELEGYGSEEPLVMPNSYACYESGSEPDFDPTPAFEKNGFITFGTFNNPNKYTPTIIESWAKCLLAAPNSIFMFIRPEVGSEVLRENLQNEFAKHGVDKERVQFHANPLGQHLHLYRALDISLDVFPLTGGTTTCESMSMGVPVVSRYGPFHHSRLSRSFISNAGFPDLCADNEAQFVNIAANLADDPKLLRWLHANLRPIMRSSPLCDAQLFSDDFKQMLATVVSTHGLR